MTYDVITKYYSIVKIKKSEMGIDCSTYGGEKMRVQGFGWET
jgi:hypothetical protein